MITGTNTSAARLGEKPKGEKVGRAIATAKLVALNVAAVIQCGLATLYDRFADS